MHKFFKLFAVILLTIMGSSVSLAEEDSEDGNWNRNDTAIPAPGVQIAFEVSKNVASDFYPDEGRYLGLIDLIVVPPFEFYGGEFYLQVTSFVTPEGGISSDYGDRTDYLLGYYWETSEGYSVDVAGGYSDLYQFDAAFYYLQLAKIWDLPWGEQHTFRLFGQAEVLDAKYESVQVGGDIYTLGGVYGWSNFWLGGDLTVNFGAQEFSGEKSFFLGSGLDFILSDRWSVTIPQISISEPLGDSEEFAVHSIGASVLFVF